MMAKQRSLLSKTTRSSKEAASANGENHRVHDYEVTHDFRVIGLRRMRLHRHRLSHDGEALILLSITAVEDISRRSTNPKGK